MEIRHYSDLPEKLENTLWELRDKAYSYLLLDVTKAETTIKQAWDLIPNPKFDWGITHSTLYDYVRILNFVEKHVQAIKLLGTAITDAENSGYKLVDTEMYLLAGETSLFQKEYERARMLFTKAFSIGKARAFSSYPKLYLTIATNKISDNTSIETEFLKNNVNRVLLEQVKDEQGVDFELSEKIAEKIEKLSEEGNTLFDDANFKDAIKIWNKALKLIPQPQNIYHETMWLLSSIGDAYFHLHDFTTSMDYFMKAKNSIVGDGYSNPFILLRLGQSFLEIGDNTSAKEYLSQAYKLEGKKLFKEEDKKYVSFLQEHVKLK